MSFSRAFSHSFTQPPSRRIHNYTYLIRTFTTSSHVSPFNASSNPSVAAASSTTSASAATHNQSTKNTDSTTNDQHQQRDNNEGEGRVRDNIFTLIRKNPVPLFISFFAFSTLISTIRIYSNASKYRQEIEEKESIIDELNIQLEGQTNRSHQLRNHVMNTIDTLIQRSNQQQQQQASALSSFRRTGTSSSSQQQQNALQQTLQQIKEDLQYEFNTADRNAKLVTDVIHNDTPFVLTHGTPQTSPQQPHNTPRMIA